MNEIKFDETLNLRNVPCPKNSALALVKLETMDPGELLEVIVDEGEPIENVPPSIEEDGDYKIISRSKTQDGRWSLLVEVL